MGQSILELSVKEEYERLLKLKSTGEILRMGALFASEFNNYLYDTGTGKVVLLDDESYHFLSNLFDVKRSMKEYDEDFLVKFINELKSENLLQAKEVKTLSSYDHTERLEDALNTGLSQIILELTGRCNLRCGYCIYNEECNMNRDFNQNDMSMETAKAAIEYARDHSGEEVAITFYGGEPLVRYDLLRWSIEYAQEVLVGKKITYSFTTNLTLMTEEMAEFFSTIPNLTILCSIDGPEDVQNAYRKYINGKGSYQDAYRGLKILSEKIRNSGLDNRVSINAVFAPPYSYEKLDRINDFFKSLDFLPPHTNIRIEYVSSGSIDDKEFMNEMKENAKYTHNSDGIINPLWIWKKKHFLLNSNEEENSIFMSSMQMELAILNKRIVTDKPIDRYSFNGCCVPGMRRLYVSTEGKFYVCEKIGLSPSIGDIQTGINIERVRKYYVDEYIEKSLNACKKCWAIHLCKMCYAGCYDENGINMEVKSQICESMRNEMKYKLSFLHELIDMYPDKLEFLKDIVIS